MLKHGKTAMIVAITLGVLGSASAALAGTKDDDGGTGAGGYLVPGSSVGVNPVYHPELFAQQQSANTAFAQAQQQTKKPPRDKKASSNSSSNSSKESDEEARLRRFYDNR